MTMTRYQIVRHADFPSMLFRVQESENTEGRMTVRPYKLSDFDGSNVSVPVEGWSMVAENYNSLSDAFPGVNFESWTYDTLGDAAEKGFACSLRMGGDTRYDILSYDSREFTISGHEDRSVVGTYDATDYRMGSAGDWERWKTYKAELFKGLVAGYVVKITSSLPTYDGMEWHYAILKYDWSEYPEQYAYLVNPDTLERSNREYYVHGAVCVPTGWTLEQLQTELSTKCAVGNVVLTRNGDYAVVLSETDTGLSVSVLSDSLEQAEATELKRFHVEAVMSERFDEQFKAMHAIRLEQAKALQNLSINTVNRALAHADSNGYCSETLIALTSAGHKVPKVRIKGTLTIPLDIEIDAQNDWETVRRIFGRKFNSNQSWKQAALDRLNIASYVNLTTLANEATELEVEPIYGKPVVRPL